MIVAQCKVTVEPDAAPATDSPTDVPVTTPSSERLVSLDALRGYTMFWILGADSFFTSLSRFGDTGWTAALAAQFQHVRWAGLRFYDLIFPMFVFIVGVSIVFSLDRIVQRAGRAAAHVRVLRRFALIFLLGVFYDGGIAYAREENLLCGVLQRVALCYLLAALLYLNLRLRGLVVTCVTILVGYWALMSFVPVPGEPAASFARDHNWSDYIDRLAPPYHHRDPEGLLSTLPASCSALLGVFAGLLMKARGIDDRRKVRALMVGGLVLAAAGLLWSLQYSLIKRVWTSSYVLVAGGHSAVMLSIFYTVIDRWKMRKWATPLIWIGMNPITLYMAVNVADMGALARRLVGGDIESAVGPSGEMLVSAVAMAMVLLLARSLYERRVFIRL